MMNVSKPFYRKAPSECLPQELADFETIVVAGGQVQQHGLDELIRAAKWLGFGLIDGVLASVAAIKQPRASYRDRVFADAKSPEIAEHFAMEFGWACTLDAYKGKGLGSGIADVLLADIHTFIFATTGESNEVTKHILTKRGFQISGAPHPGRDESKVLLVRR
jgi:hypothetical protein